MNLSITLSTVLSVIGFIIAIIGVIWYELSRRGKMSVSIWAYVLMITGVILLIVGLVLVTYFVIKSQQST